jgi:hypothetical protein
MLEFHIGKSFILDQHIDAHRWVVRAEKLNDEDVLSRMCNHPFNVKSALNN